jgi:hypothetical protein
VIRRILLSAAILAAFVPAAQAAAQSAASPYTTGHRYDGAGRPTGTILPDPDGAGPLLFPATRFTYDSAGRLTAEEKGHLAAWQSEDVAPANWSGFVPASLTELAYDGRGRKRTARSPPTARSAPSPPGNTMPAGA